MVLFRGVVLCYVVVCLVLVAFACLDGFALFGLFVVLVVCFLFEFVCLFIVVLVLLCMVCWFWLVSYV